MSESQIYSIAIGAFITVMLGLAGVVWSLIRQESVRSIEALEKKASTDSLKEAKTDFNMRLEKQYMEFNQRIREMSEQQERGLRELSERQDREIDWMKDEMDKISNNLAEMRRENSTANAAILQRLQDLAMAVGQKK